MNVKPLSFGNPFFMKLEQEIFVIEALKYYTFVFLLRDEI